MTPEQEERAVVALEAIANALGGKRVIPGVGIGRQRGNGRMNSIAAQTLNDSADVALQFIANNPSARERDIWQAIKNHINASS